MTSEMKSELIQQQEKLSKQKQGMTEYLLLKASQEDWHGVADAAMDIREIVSKMNVIDNILTQL